MGNVIGTLFGRKRPNKKKVIGVSESKVKVSDPATWRLSRSAEFQKIIKDEQVINQNVMSQQLKSNPLMLVLDNVLLSIALFQDFEKLVSE